MSGRPSGPRNKIYSHMKTVDKVPEDLCRTCGEKVRFITCDGRLIAVHPTTLERHPVPKPIAFTRLMSAILLGVAVVMALCLCALVVAATIDLLPDPLTLLR